MVTFKVHINFQYSGGFVTVYKTSVVAFRITDSPLLQL